MATQVESQDNLRSVIEDDEEEVHETSNEESDSEYDTDESESDPTFDVLEETQARLSSLSIRKSKSRLKVESDSGKEDGVIVNPLKLGKEEEKTYEHVQTLIEAGQLEKLKVDQCKVYLRKHGLRLTGNKETLLQRIKEHLGIINGGGERKYPVSSFVMNCKGDACTGDVVLFEQNVYEMFNIASRSAIGPPCGKRIVAGRIIKESYGSAKQQHTFTIEVLWSKGEKPLPPLHPLLIKGRNLYRMKTLRQRWEDEGKRQRVLMEKHSRGSLARSDREARVQEKEMRKMTRANKVSKESTKSLNMPRGKLTAKPPIQPQELDSSYNSRSEFIHPPLLSSSTVSVDAGNPARKPESQQSPYWGLSAVYGQPIIQHQRWDQWPRNPTFQSSNNSGSSICSDKIYGRGVQKRLIERPNIYTHSHLSHVGRYPNSNQSSDKGRGPLLTSSLPYRNGDTFSVDKYPRANNQLERNYHRQPFTSMDNCPSSPLRRQVHTREQLCRYYARGKCHFGDNCRFLHGTRDVNGHRSVTN